MTDTGARTGLDRNHLRRRQFSRRRRRRRGAARPPSGDVRHSRLGRSQTDRALCASLDRDRTSRPVFPPGALGALPRSHFHRHGAAAADHSIPAGLADDHADAAHHARLSRRRRQAALRDCRRGGAGGLRVIGVKDVAPEIFVPEGVLGRYQPSSAIEPTLRVRSI